MGLTIIRTDSRGVYRLIAERDLYLDESGQKVIVVKDGEVVPPEAAVVLAGKGGTIPTRYAKLLEQVEAAPEVVPEVQPEPEPSKPEPAPAPEPAPKPKPVKTKSTEEKAAL